MTLKFAILGSLARVPASGYDLLRRFDRKINFIWWASHGAVYTELQRLESSGLVVQGEEGARGRLEHRVTDAGLQELRAWLKSPSVRRPRDEAILRVLYLWALPLREAADYFDELAGIHRARLDEYELRAPEDEDADLDPAELFDLIALRAGIATEKAMIAWAQDASATVRRIMSSGDLA